MLIWQLLMTLVALGALGVAILAVVNVSRSAHRTQQTELRLERKLDQLEGELSAMMDGAFGVAKSLHEVEKNLKDTSQRQEQLQQRDLGNLPYNEAVRLASKGASADDLVELCGLSRSEAELVELLHKQSSMSDSENKLSLPEAAFSTPFADGEPSANRELSAGKEPSANRESSAGKEPSTGIASFVDIEPSVDIEAFANRASSVDMEPSANREPSAGKEPSAGQKPSAPEADDRPFVSGRRATGGDHSNDVTVSASLSLGQSIDLVKP